MLKQDESKSMSGILSWVIPIGFFLVGRFAVTKMRPGMGVMPFGKRRIKLFAQSETRATFVDVAGMVAVVLKIKGLALCGEGFFNT